MNYDNSYKKTGELEKIGIEPLPPTSLSENASKKLESWGLTVEQIDYLRQFTSQFRYDLCAKKIDRLSQKKAEIFEQDGQEFVNFPSFYDVNGRLDGQCGDIGKQWIIQINETDLIKTLNAQRSDGNRIVTCFYTGLSKTHFCNEGSNHVWNGLALLDKQDNVLGEVYFDAAFQAIFDKPESGYTQKSAVFSATSLESTENASIPIGWVKISGKSWSGNVPGSAVLGVSNDFQHSYLIGFVKDRKTLKIKPIIGRINAEGKSDCFFYGNDDEILSSRGTLTTAEQMTEIKELLDIAKKIRQEKREPTINRVNWIHKDVSDSP